VWELPHSFERQLYLIVRDETIIGADPERNLREALFREGALRLREAKALTADCFDNVPAVARDQFLQLMQALPDTAGITRIDFATVLG
jgi:hypothetical protein